MPCRTGINLCSCERSIEKTGTMPEECFAAIGMFDYYLLIVVNLVTDFTNIFV